MSRPRFIRDDNGNGKIIKVIRSEDKKKSTGRTPGFNASPEGFVVAPPVKPTVPTSAPHFADGTPVTAENRGFEGGGWEAQHAKFENAKVQRYNTFVEFETYKTLEEEFGLAMTELKELGRANGFKDLNLDEITVQYHIAGQNDVPIVIEAFQSHARHLLKRLNATKELLLSYGNQDESFENILGRAEEYRNEFIKARRAEILNSRSYSESGTFRKQMLSDLHRILENKEWSAKNTFTNANGNLFVGRVALLEDFYGCVMGPVGQEVMKRIENIPITSEIGNGKPYDIEIGLPYIKETMLPVEEVFQILRGTTPEDLASNKVEIIPGDGSYCNHRWQFSHMGARQVCRLCFFVLTEG